MSETQEKINRVLQLSAVKRRTFLAGLGTAAVATVIPFSGCTSKPKAASKTFQFSAAQFKIIKAVQEHLFPHEPEAPGASDVHAAEYLQMTLGQPGFDPEIRDFLLSGIEQFQTFLTENRISAFETLSADQREHVLLEVRTLSWGENWLSLLLTYIFEALLSDPVYGGNTDEIGWKWLEHIPGLPRPTQATRYGASIRKETNKL